MQQMPTVKPAYDKPWVSTNDHIERLKTRGLVIDDPQYAEYWINLIGYYRLKGYLHPLRKTHKDENGKTVAESAFKDNAKIEHAISLYLYDKQLRLLMLDAIEVIEVAVRTAMCEIVGNKDVAAHTVQSLLRDSAHNPNPQGITPHEAWLAKVNTTLAKSNSEGLNHLKNKYAPPLPIWAVSETWDFGTMSMFFSYLKSEHQKPLAQMFGFSRNSDRFSSWLHRINVARNVCAHHSRFWNATSVATLSLLPSQENYTFTWGDEFLNDTKRWNWIKNKQFLTICVTAHMLDSLNQHGWSQSIFDHLRKLPALQAFGIDHDRLGVTKNWESFFQKHWKVIAPATAVPCTPNPIGA